MITVVMKGGRRKLVIVVVFSCLGCKLDMEARRRSVNRSLYDDYCARGHNVWRMFYQGTDSAHHNFFVNDMDRWDWQRIAVGEIALADVRPRPMPDSLMGYYCVDPCSAWRKTGCSLLPAPARRPQP